MSTRGMRACRRCGSRPGRLSGDAGVQLQHACAGLPAVRRSRRPTAGVGARMHAAVAHRAARPAARRAAPTPARSARRAPAPPPGAAARRGSGSRRWRWSRPGWARARCRRAPCARCASGRSSSSATICASAVCMPVPRSTWPFSAVDAAVVPHARAGSRGLRPGCPARAPAGPARRRRGRRVAHDDAARRRPGGNRRACAAGRRGASRAGARPRSAQRGALHRVAGSRHACRNGTGCPTARARMRASLGCGSRASSAAACITMPLRQ